MIKNPKPLIFSEWLWDSEHGDDCEETFQIDPEDIADWATIASGLTREEFFAWLEAQWPAQEAA